MAKFVNGASSYGEITEIINGAYSELYIVTPYLKIPQQTKNYIRNVDKRGIKFTIISRAENNTEKNVNETDIQFLKELTSANIRVCENLHAKCFLNENKGLVTSMNLHEHSQTHNWEMGIVFTKADDPAIYNDTLNEVMMIMEQSIENPKTKRVPIASIPLASANEYILQKTNQKPEATPNNKYSAENGASKFAAKESRESNVTFAGFWLRLTAAIIDGLILLIPFYFCIVLAGSNNVWLAYFLIWIIGFGYFAFLESSARRATYGKEAVGLIVINMDGSHLTFQQASIRYIGKLASLFILYIGFIMIGFTEKKQGLHDMIAKTLVIKK
ncbi:MAG: RDD family protein [Methanoregula sp.]|nr:RDD family protein [Methanoregula sp.]